MRFKPRSERDEHHRHSEQSRGTPLRKRKAGSAGPLDFSRGLRDPLGMTTSMTLEKVIEALLFSAQKPLSIHEITAAIKEAEGDQENEMPNEIKRVENEEVAAALEQLKVEDIHQSRPSQLAE